MSRRRMFAWGTIAFTMLVLPALLVGCGGGGGGGGGGGTEDPTADSLTREGWSAFEDGDLAAASMRFADALALDADHVDAFVGQAWVGLRRLEFATAADRFAQALQRDAGNLDALAGEVLVAVAAAEPSAVRPTAAALLLAGPNYRFAHDKGYSVSDIRWFAARAALEMADYAAVGEQLDSLAPDHGLDPGAAAFVEQAAALLESLRTTV